MPSRKTLPNGPIATAVAKAIERAGLSLTQFSGVCDVPRSTLSLWLNGRRNITVAQLERVLKALDRRLVNDVVELIDATSPVTARSPRR